LDIRNLHTIFLEAVLFVQFAVGADMSSGTPAPVEGPSKLPTVKHGGASDAALPDAGDTCDPASGWTLSPDLSPEERAAIMLLLSGGGGGGGGGVGVSGRAGGLQVYSSVAESCDCEEQNSAEKKDDEAGGRGAIKAQARAIDARRRHSAND
jgi:hypothetical protein